MPPPRTATVRLAETAPLLFLASSFATLIVACLVVGGQALRAARSQPAQGLRYE
jgi:hypothetical protein